MIFILALILFLPSAALAAQSVVILPTATYSGTTQVGPVAVNQSGLRYVGVSIDRTSLKDPSVTITFTSDVSFDNGATWHLFCGARTVGGALSGLLGPLLSSDIYCGDPIFLLQKNRLVRAFLTISAGKTAVTQLRLLSK